MRTSVFDLRQVSGSLALRQPTRGCQFVIHWKSTLVVRIHDRKEGTTTTPFDMVVLNNLDRYQLALDAIRRIPRLAGQVGAETARFDATLQRHKRYIAEHDDDMPEIVDWRWTR